MAAIMALTMAAGSCIDKENYRPGKNQELRPMSEYFSFNTSSAVNLTVDYGQLAAGALVEVYASNPLEGITEAGMRPATEALFKAHLDADGRFSQAVDLPAGCQRVFVYTDSYAAPMLMAADVQGNVASVVVAAPTRTRAEGRLASDLQVFPTKRADVVTLFDGSTEYGNVNSSQYDRNGLMSTGTLNADFYSSLQYMLWGGKTSKPSGLNNRKYAVGSDVTNTVLVDKAINPATGDEETVESANIFFTLVGEAAWYENAVGYYYYDTANPPADPSELKKFVILPNTSITNNAPYGVKGNYLIDNKYAPTYTNMRVQLLYQDADGNLTPDFPAGITVGYFIISNAFAQGSSHITSLSLDRTFYYSNELWNKGSEKRFIALAAKDGSLVYGVEDGSSDFSADDLLFTISASPNFAIRKPTELPTIDEDMNERITYTDQVTEQTYAYEDVWPEGGDYDLNDVIIEHRRTVTFNQKNFVSKVVDEFTPVQKSGSAEYVNAFAVQYDPNMTERIAASDGVVREWATNSYIVFDNTSTGKGQTRTITREFGNSLAGGLAKAKIDAEDINPFIISRYVKGSTLRAEVHLPKSAATSYADASLIGQLDDAYYINKDGKHPFAIRIPIIGWTPAAERVSVSKAFPSYDVWVSSNGAKGADWYLGK